jgi:predicted DNA-binding protein
MTLQITLPEETEDRLKQQAARRGLSLPQYLQMVAQWEAESADAEALTNDEIRRLQEGIERGFRDEAAGRTRPLADFVREQREKHGLSNP